MKTKMTSLLVFSIATLFLTFCNVIPATASDEIVWKMAGVWGPGDTAIPPETVAREITEKSKGRLKVKTFPGGQLYAGKDIFGALQKGLIQMAEIPIGYWAGAIPLYKFGEMPFLIRNNDEFKAYLEAGFFELMQKAAEKHGLMMLGVMGWNDAQLFSRFPVESASDLTGKKLRVWTPAMAAGVQAMGASPVSMGATEVYQAMQTGVIDAAFGGVSWAYSNRWHEVGKNLIKLDFCMPPTAIFIQKKAFEALPKDLQKIVLAAGKNYMTLSWALVDKLTPKKYKQFKQDNSVIYEVPEELRQKWMENSKHIWFEQAEKIGPEGKEALDIYFTVFPERKPKNK